jgi:hypothetical protein
MITNKEIFNDLKNPLKLNRLKEINNILNIKYDKIIFVYSQPKVGSTSLVSSLRLFNNNNCHIIHIHDEIMLKTLKGIDDIKINEIIAYNKYIGKEIYVIDIYRDPIERKISCYFEKIGCYHFNNIDEKVNKYNINKVINRFNKIFLHIGNGDHFLDIYPISYSSIPNKFDVANKYLLIEDYGIKYIKLRLKDSNEWGNILSELLNIKIYIVKDYETTNKTIKDLYLKFKEYYKIPKNLLEIIMKDKYLNYYNNEEEIKEYYNLWNNKCTDNFVSFTEEEYKLYEYITLENSHLDYIQLNKSHYIDEGCICKICNIKRINIANKIKTGNYNYNNDKIIHEEAKKELIINKVSKLNKKIIVKIKNGRKDFSNEMNNIVYNIR